MTFDALGLALAAIVAIGTTSAVAGTWTVGDPTVEMSGAPPFAAVAKVPTSRSRYLPYDRADLP